MRLDTWWRRDWARLCVALVASAYFLYYASTPTGWHFIDNVDLIIHEAGHWVFFPFGEFVRILGGSLFQCAFPQIYVVYFLRRRDYFAGSLLLFWVGANLINVSVYASDAIVMQLPLLGGDAVTHDWNHLLGELHALRYTPQIGYGMYSIGALMILGSGISSILTSQSATQKL